LLLFFSFFLFFLASQLQGTRLDGINSLLMSVFETVTTSCREPRKANNNNNTTAQQNIPTDSANGVQPKLGAAGWSNSGEDRLIGSNVEDQQQ
jgi:hypothetical protein